MVSSIEKDIRGSFLRQKNTLLVAGDLYPSAAVRPLWR